MSGRDFSNTFLKTCFYNKQSTSESLQTKLELKNMYFIFTFVGSDSDITNNTRVPTYIIDITGFITKHYLLFLLDLVSIKRKLCTLYCDHSCNSESCNNAIARPRK